MTAPNSPRPQYTELANVYFLFSYLPKHLIFIMLEDRGWGKHALWPPHAKSWLTGKDPDAGRDWGQEEKETTEDEMAGWRHRLDGNEFV